MSSNLETVLNKIQTNKNINVKPENIRYGVDILGVNGTMRPVEVTGGDTGTCIYTQNETPTDFNGIWINTDKNCNDIYVEDSYCPTVEQPIFQGFDEGDENVVYNTVPPYDIVGATTCQIGNVIHFFGAGLSTRNEAPSNIHSNHYKYDFETNTWTKLADCPTPQGFGGAVNIGNYIYVIGCGFADYFNYVYKYNIENDSWEKVGEMTGSDFTLTLDTSSTTSIDRCPYCNVCKDDNDNIYVMFGPGVNDSHLFKLNKDTVILTELGYESHGSLEWYNADLVYYNGYILFGAYRYNYGSAWGLYYYNISTSTVSLLHSFDNSSEYLCGSKLNYNGYLYITNSPTIMVNEIASNELNKVQEYTISNNHDIEEIYFLRGKNSNNWKNYKTKQFIVTKDNVDYLLMFGPASYSTTRTMAIRLTDKTYDLDNDTVMIYTDKNAGGLYKTQMFNSTRVIGTGKLYSYFSNVNLYDATQQQIIKNLTTYYGNGTEWVKLK